MTKASSFCVSHLSSTCWFVRVFDTFLPPHLGLGSAQWGLVTSRSCDLIVAGAIWMKWVGGSVQLVMWWDWESIRFSPIPFKYTLQIHEGQFKITQLYPYWHQSIHSRLSNFFLCYGPKLATSKSPGPSSSQYWWSFIGLIWFFAELSLVSFWFSCSVSGLTALFQGFILKVFSLAW